MASPSYNKDKDKDKDKEVHCIHRVAVRVTDRDYKLLKAKSYETNLSYSDIMRLGLKKMLA